MDGFTDRQTDGSKNAKTEKGKTERQTVTWK